MADDNEEYGYDPGTSESNQEPAYQEPYQDAPVQETQGASQEPVPSEYGGDIPTEEQGQQNDERSWLMRLIDDARSTFGINEEAVPTEAESEGAAKPYPDTVGDVAIPGLEKADRPELTPESGIGDVLGSAASKAGGQISDALGTAGTAIKNAVAPSDEERQMMTTPQEGPLKKMLREYVTGAGGMPNVERKAREAQYAANTGAQNMTKSELREGALKQAATEGMDKGVAMLQNYKANQINYKALAAGALDHGDRDSAAKLFNEGHSFVPDGAHAIASPSANGVLMAVRNNATGETKSTLLTDDQFRDMLHNRSGEFDHLTDQGLQKMIDQVARTPGMPKSNQMSNAQPGGAGVANTPGATVPGQVGPTAAPAAPMNGAGVSNLPQGASVPQVGNQSALPSETPLPQPNPLREAPPAGARGPSAADRADALLGRPVGSNAGRAGGYSRDMTPVGGMSNRITGEGGRRLPRETAGDTITGGKGPFDSRGLSRTQRAANGEYDVDRTRMTPTQKYGRDVRDPDGWPTGIPRGGQFTPSGKLYDAKGHTYDVGRDGLPLAQQGQPGWHGPTPGQARWTGTQNGEFLRPQGQGAEYRPNDARPQVIQRQPWAQQRADTNAQIKREGLAVKERLGTGGLDVKREANEIKRDLGTKGNELKGRDIESKVDTRARGVTAKEGDLDRKNRQGDEGNQIKREGIAQKDRFLEFKQQNEAAKLDQRKVEALSKATGHDVGKVMDILREKARSGIDWSPKEKSYYDEIRRRSLGMQ